ncbi:TonB family protein [bacterium]|nr:TonB family protein [bacterium]
MRTLEVILAIMLFLVLLYVVSKPIPRIVNTSRPIPVAPPPAVQEPPRPAPDPPSAPELELVGNPAPPFGLPDLNGSYIRLSNLQGKVVVLNFWASWCPPCRMEIPHFVELRNRYSDRGLEILGVSVEGQDAQGTLQNFIAENNVNYSVLIASSAVLKEYGDIRAVPTTFLIDANGIVRKKLVGYQDLNTWEAEIKPMLPLAEQPEFTNDPPMIANNSYDQFHSSKSGGRLLRQEPAVQSRPMFDRDAQFVRGPRNRPVRHIRVEISPAIAIRRVSPVYPRHARIMGIEGRVVIRVEVLADGSVGVISFVRAVHPLLDQAAAEAVQRWEFQPAFDGQQPVDSFKIVGIDFHLKR